MRKKKQQKRFHNFRLVHDINVDDDSASSTENEEIEEKIDEKPKHSSLWLKTEYVEDERSPGQVLNQQKEASRWGNDRNQLRFWRGPLTKRWEFRPKFTKTEKPAKRFSFKRSRDIESESGLAIRAWKKKNNKLHFFALFCVREPNLAVFKVQPSFFSFFPIFYFELRQNFVYDFSQFYFKNRLLKLLIFVRFHVIASRSLI